MNRFTTSKQRGVHKTNNRHCDKACDKNDEFWCKTDKIRYTRSSMPRQLFFQSLLHALCSRGLPWMDPLEIHAKLGRCDRIMGEPILALFNIRGHRYLGWKLIIQLGYLYCCYRNPRNLLKIFTGGSTTSWSRLSYPVSSAAPSLWCYGKITVWKKLKENDNLGRNMVLACNTILISDQILK